MKDEFNRRHFITGLLPMGLAFSSVHSKNSFRWLKNTDSLETDPTKCAYAPPGEYIKDHSFLFHDGWWHFFSISGTAGYYHGYNGNEETISWSISRDLVKWEFRGHVLHASQWPGSFDQHEVWAPFVFKGSDRFFMFYAGIIHPSRPMEYRKMGHDHPWVFEGHQEAMGLAVSDDLTYWDKIADFKKGLSVKGRDAHVVFDKRKNRYLLYSTIGTHQAHVSQSSDLIHWESIGICLEFPRLDPDGKYGSTTNGISNFLNSAESLHVMQHPLSGKWIIMGNWQYAISDDPVDFSGSKVRKFDRRYKNRIMDMGFACEILRLNDKWYRSGVFGERDYWKLGFTEIKWNKEGAFNIIHPSILSE
jgi:hypothetical protein